MKINIYFHNSSKGFSTKVGNLFPKLLFDGTFLEFGEVMYQIHADVNVTKFELLFKISPIFFVIASTGWWVDLCHSYLINNMPRTAAGKHSYPINTRDSYRPFDVVPAEIKLRQGVLISDIIISRRNHIQENICYFARFMSAMELRESFLICWRFYSRHLKGREKGRHLHMTYLNIFS